MKNLSSALMYRIIFAVLIIAMLIINGVAVPGLLNGGTDTTQPTDEAPIKSEAKTETQPTATQTQTTITTLPVTLPPATTAAPTQPATEEPTHAVEAPPFNRSEELQKLITPLAATPVGYSYFDNSVFLGDSVMLGFQMHVNNLKKAQLYSFPLTHFICGKSYGVYNALREIGEKTVHPLYEGEQRYPWDVIKIYAPEKVFISLGLNDVGMLTKSRYISDYLTLIKNIRDQLPGVQIIILSITPLTEEGQLKVLNNEKINEYNNALIMMAYENNCSFVDVAESVRDYNGHLPSKLSSDNYCHLTFEAYEKIIQYHMSHPAIIGRYPDIVLPGEDKPVIAPPATTAAPKPAATTKAPETTKAPATTKAPDTTKAPVTAPPATTQTPTTAPTAAPTMAPTMAPTTAPTTHTVTTTQQATTQAPSQTTEEDTQPSTQPLTDILTDTAPTEPYIDSED